MKVYARDAAPTDSDLVWLAKQLVQTYELRTCREGDFDQVVRRIVGNAQGGCGYDQDRDEHYDYRVEGRWVKWERGPRRGRTSLLELCKLAGRYGDDDLCSLLREVDALWSEAHDRPYGWTIQPPKQGSEAHAQLQKKQALASEAYRRWRHLRDAWWAIEPAGQGGLF